MKFFFHLYYEIGFWIWTYNAYTMDWIVFGCECVCVRAYQPFHFFQPPNKYNIYLSICIWIYIYISIHTMESFCTQIFTWCENLILSACKKLNRKDICLNLYMCILCIPYSTIPIYHNIPKPPYRMYTNVGQYLRTIWWAWMWFKWYVAHNYLYVNGMKNESSFYLTERAK